MIIYINENPRTGDIIIVKVLSDNQGYSTAENSYGRLVQLYKDDIFIGVLGDRQSGTNNVGIVPKRSLNRGDIIHLLSQGGIVGEIICADNRQRNGFALSLSVIGFIKKNGALLNIEDLQQKTNNGLKVTDKINKHNKFR
ncbi:hypothetical protein [Rummeliibacillus suwonensis]|uniref:hypothetical protein n=1 Tax=Rummeliibacillus suwonensis TaxID=1306154 RepID=UPI001AAF1C2B|nr:hypothetical protein [Rummeliibacillus suwonensis]MBO2537753.1 hypothetical protein [Rummeliibacillus suwonensis]